MHSISKGAAVPFLLAMLSLPMTGALHAQQPASTGPDITVTGIVPPDASQLTAGPEIKGTIVARTADKMKVLGVDGSSTIVFITEATKIKSGSGLFGGGKNLRADSLLNGLPVTVKTLQWSGGLVANQVTFKNNDLKTAAMIRNGTNQRFEEQAAATESLRSRMADIDKYNILSTTNVYFDTGKSALTPEAKGDLCRTASTADASENALMLVVGYTDSVGSEEYNQTLSEKRAASVINFLQQVCHWKPYRMLTPTGMAEADPQASNDTPEGKAQNRRVSVNVLVSKSLEGM